LTQSLTRDTVIVSFTRRLMRAIARSAMVAMLIAGLCNLPSMAAVEKSLGVVAQAEHARLDSVAVAVGATVYAGDSFDTDASGTLRLRLGSSQLYLLPQSAAKLAQSSSGAVVTLVSGTAGFSSPASGGLALATPAGLLRAAAGKAAYGQVSMHGEKQILVSAFRGDLVLDNEGEFHNIPEGKSYRVEISDDGDSRADDNPDFIPPQNHHRKRRLAFILIFGGALAAGSFAIWQELSESPSKPN
jgi:hypothetical protein